MSSIDRRVVAMQFDHDQFERGVRSTINDLAELEKSLELKDVGSNIDKIASKFNVFGAIGFAGLQRLTNGAIDLGQKMAKALVDPIVEGGRKRSLNIEQAKFQFQGLGLDVETAMANALYAVKGTAYGLDEAASAASQLAASQVSLGTEMETSLRGISGLAAMTNSSYSDIANIFVKVAGQGRLMGDDLNRIGVRGINAAAMLAEAFDTTEENVRKMVAKGEIDFQTFATAMNDAFGEQATKANDTYTGSLSNMRAALARVGEMIWTPKNERARRFYNALTPVIDDVANAIKPLVGLYEQLSEKGAQFWENFFGSIDASQLKKIFTPLVRVIENSIKLVGDFGRHIKRAWVEIFGQPSETSWIERASQWLWDLRDTIQSLRPSGKTLANFQRTFAGLFAAMDIAWMVIRDVGKFLGDLISYIFTGSSGFLEFTGSIGDWIVSIRDAMKEGEGLSKFLQDLSGFIKVPIDILKNLGSVLRDLFTSLKDGTSLEGIGEKFKAAFEPLGYIGERLKETFSGITPHLKKFWDWISPFFSDIAEKAQNFGKKVGEAFRKADFSALYDLVNTGLLATLVIGFKKLLDGFTNIVNDSGSIRESITSIFTGVTDTLGAMQTQLKAGTLLRIAGAIGILAVAILLLASIDPVALTISLGAIAVLFGELMGALAIFTKIVNMGGGMAFAKMPVIATGLLILSGAIAVLSIAVKNLSNVDWEGLAKGLVGVAVILASLAGFTHILKGKTRRLITTATGMVILASAVRVMVTAVEKLGAMDLETLGKGVASVAAILAIFAGFTQISKTKWFSFIPTATGMVILAYAVHKMYDAVKDFATMDWHSIGRGLAAMAGAMAILTMALNFTPASSIFGAAGLFIVMYSLEKLVPTLKAFGDMKWGEIAKASVMLLASLGLIAAAMWVMIEALPGAAALFVVAYALGPITDALVKMGKMSWGEIGRASVMLLASLGLIAAAMALMIPALPGALALIVIAGALAILAPILKLFGSMEWEEIGKSLVMLAGALGVIGLVSLILAPVVPVIAALAFSIGLLGAAIFGIGAGVFLFAAGLAALATSGALGIAFLIGLVDELIELIPKAMEKFGEGIVKFAEVIERGAPALMRAFEAIFTEWLMIIERMSPLIVDVMANLLLLMLSKIEEYLPQYVDKGTAIVIGFLEGVERRMPDIAAAGTNLAVTFILEVAKGLAKIVHAVALGMLLFIRKVRTTVTKYAPQLRSEGRKLAFAIVDGMTGGLMSTVAESRIGRAAGWLASKAMAGAKWVLGIKSPSREFYQIGMFVGEGMALGISSSSEEVEKSAEGMGRSALSQISDTMTQLKDLILDDIDTEPTIRPVLDLDNIRSGMSEMDKTISSRNVNVESHYSKAASILADRQRSEEASSEKEAKSEGTTIHFEQNNYSPKALSTAEIYRQTRNQISRAKQNEGV